MDKEMNRSWRDCRELCGNVMRPGAGSARTDRMFVVSQTYTLDAAAKRLELRQSQPFQSPAILFQVLPLGVCLEAGHRFGNRQFDLLGPRAHDQGGRGFDALRERLAGAAEFGDGPSASRAEARCDAILIRCASPPDSVVAGWPSRR